MSRKSRRAKRKAKHDARRRQSLARENAQLAGDIPTTPAGALRPEAVPPCADPPQPKLIQMAIRRGWAVPDERKPELVDELIAIVINPDMPEKVKVAAFNALRQADQAQYEQDHPTKPTAPTTPLTLNVNVVTVDSKPALEIDDHTESDDKSLQ